MKRAFTLIELLIVVVIIATLMAVTFKLVSVGGESAKRNETIVCLQKVENCLSGYFAAFGSYPPVPLIHSRSIYSNHLEDNNSGERLNADNVAEACRAQPVAARFPFAPSMDAYVESCSRIMSERANSSDPQWKAYKDRITYFGPGFRALHNLEDAPGWNQSEYWDDVKIFQFGLMSFLLPRYLFMTQGVSGNAGGLANCAQWTSNNRLSANPDNGNMFGSWEAQFSDSNFGQLMRIPSQAVCARWIANLKGIVDCSSANATFFGVRVASGYCELNPDNVGYWRNIYLNQNNTVLDSLTVCDGWRRELYYYSAPPYQSYRLWSAGPNGLTFPPWVPLNKLENDRDRQRAADWMKDDIEFLNN